MVRPAASKRVVVIGSGPAGAAAAWTLIKQGVPVTMLESGGQPPHGLHVRLFGRDLLRSLPPRTVLKRHVASTDASTVWHAELIAGGLSNWWAGATPRFAPEDFFEGERLHERYRWPLDYADLERHYENVEQLMPVSGTQQNFPVVPACNVQSERPFPADWQALAKAAQRSGHSLFPLPVADEPSFQLSRYPSRFNSFTSIISRIPPAADFQLQLGAHALRIEHDGGAKPKANAVIYRDRNTGQEQRIDAAGVVVAGGTLATTQLLLASTSPEFPNGLGNTHDLLGRYLHDHPSGLTYFLLDRAIQRISVAAHFSRAPYATSEPLRAASGTVGNVTFARSLINKRPGLTSTRDLVCTWFGTIIPTEDTSALLHRDRVDDFGLPWLDIRLHHDPASIATIDAARARLMQLLDATGHKANVVREVHRPPGDSVHYGGTARMHTLPKYGVLDAFSRMHAVQNVVVADAASFTTGAEKNPTLTMMALAARGCEQLAADLR